MDIHPEQGVDEVFVGNVETAKGIRLELRPLKTVRLGNVAYYFDGKKIPVGEEPRMRPMFVGRNEEQRYSDIMMDRTFGPAWRRR